MLAFGSPGLCQGTSTDTTGARGSGSKSACRTAMRAPRMVERMAMCAPRRPGRGRKGRGKAAEKGAPNKEKRGPGRGRKQVVCERSALNRPNLSHDRPNLAWIGQAWHRTDKIWQQSSSSAKICPESINICSSLAKIARVWPIIDQAQSKFPWHRPPLAEFRPHLARTRPNLGRFGRRNDDLGALIEQ